MRNFLLLFLLFSVFYQPVVSACPLRLGDGDETDILIIEGGKDNGGQNHRSSDVIPIEASYSSSLSSILLTFIGDLGSVTVRVNNLTTGWYMQTQVNVVFGSQLLPISGDAGIYEITFTLSDGHEYIGSFEIE